MERSEEIPDAVKTALDFSKELFGRMHGDQRLQHVFFVQSPESLNAGMEFPKVETIIEWLKTNTTGHTGIFCFHDEDPTSKQGPVKHLHWLHICTADKDGTCHCWLRRRLRHRFGWSSDSQSKPATDGYITNTLAYFQNGKRRTIYACNNGNSCMERLPVLLDSSKQAINSWWSGKSTTPLRRDASREKRNGSDIDEMPEGSGQRAKRSRYSGDRKTATKIQLQKEISQELEAFYYQYLPHEKDFVKGSPVGREIIRKINMNANEERQVIDDAWIRVSYKWCRMTIQQICNEMSNHRETFNNIYPTDYNINFYSEQYSIYLMLSILKSQLHCESMIIEFLENLYQWANRAVKKKNTIYIEGNASAGKSFFFNSFIRLLWLRGTLQNKNKYESDKFWNEDILDKRVIEWNECNIPENEIQNYLEIMEGKPVRINVKYSDKRTALQTPLLIVTNKPLWSTFTGTAFHKACMDRLIIQSYWSSLPYLQYCSLELNPLLWITLFNCNSVNDIESIINPYLKLLPTDYDYFNDHKTDYIELSDGTIINKYI